MGAEILAKARDAASMFWQALDDSERRLLILAVVYAGYTGWAFLASRAHEAEREQLKAEIKEELARA